MKTSSITTFFAILSLSGAAAAQETGSDAQCRAWVDASPMVTENSCHHAAANTKFVSNEGGRPLCKVAVWCGTADWHPSPGKKRIWTLHQEHNVLNEGHIKSLKFCMDYVFGTHCEGFTHENFTKRYRKAMLEHAWWAKSLFPGKCSHLDPDADTHWCRWDTVTRLISAASVPGSGYTYKDAYKYAKNIADTRGWENWKKMVRLIEGRK